MRKFRADYFDGKNSARRIVEVRCFDSGEVQIQAEDLTIRTHRDELRFDARIGNAARHIYLKDGAQLETHDHESVDAVESRTQRGAIHRLIYVLESNLGVAIGALVLIAFVIWASIEYAVPVAARWTASSIPESVRAEIGKESLAMLDEAWMSASKLDASTRKRLKFAFRQMTESLPDFESYRLEFRESEVLGANAFALPDGTVIVTDALVKLADHDEQIVSVLAHEVGHLNHDHGLRLLLQDSLTAMLVAVALGDATSISSFAVTLPTLLVEARYSRQFEWEADGFAVDLLDRVGIAPARFAEMLDKLTKSHPDHAQSDYFSSHPATLERIARIRGSGP